MIGYYIFCFFWIFCVVISAGVFQANYNNIPHFLQAVPYIGTIIFFIFDIVLLKKRKLRPSVFKSLLVALLGGIAAAITEVFIK
ncbi:MULTISPECIES: hypothetical protein [unclassified Sporolactobacillus]|uniref:hypothetical protein n=1 Tax=unclassified Sporolactobacillus TaxID=2628533 RepID=UPI002368A4CD|nr:hypothetical protein [Sporolactobacillus sp. CQH2019]MDD9149380.1 hypothetical protein [Sporolactobacillus sp. CQH2019]